jgi:hypothetical protein
MSKRWFHALLAVSAFGLVSVPAIGGLTHKATALAHEAKIGQPAPDWSLTDTKGQAHRLSDYSGKFVVLEWTNNQCPFVQKHYRTGNMQKTQKFAVSHGAVWLSIVSSAPGTQGYVTGDQAEQILKSQHSNATAELLDPDGTVGHLFNARTTPDIMIINPKGVLIYSGGIDDKATPDDEDIKSAHNYVVAALTEAMAGKDVSNPVTRPYGCSVKYRN